MNIFSDVLCSILAEADATNDLGRLVILFRKVMDIDKGCNSLTYEYFVEAYKRSDENSTFITFGDRQFLYQKCSSLGWYPTSSSVYQPFGSGFSTELFYNMCKDIFENKLVVHKVYNIVTTIC